MKNKPSNLWVGKTSSFQGLVYIVYKPCIAMFFFTV